MYSRSVPLRGKQVSQQMRSQCESIVNRVQYAAFDRYIIQRMVLYFKADKDNRVYFLFATSLRLQQLDSSKKPREEQALHDKKMNFVPVLIEGSNFCKPDDQKQIYTTNTMRPVQIQLDQQCMNCQQLIQKQDLVHVPFKFIIDTYQDQIRKQKQTNVEVIRPPILSAQQTHSKRDDDSNKLYVRDSCMQVPELIQHIYPKMTIEIYNKMSKNEHFLSKSIMLCQQCYLYFGEKFTFSGVQQKARDNFQFYKQGLTKHESKFTKEMKYIITAKNMELVEEGILNLKDPDIYKRQLQILEQEILNGKPDAHPKTLSLSRRVMKRPQSCTNIYGQQPLLRAQRPEPPDDLLHAPQPDQDVIFEQQQEDGEAQPDPADQLQAATHKTSERSNSQFEQPHFPTQFSEEEGRRHPHLRVMQPHKASRPLLGKGTPSAGPGLFAPKSTKSSTRPQELSYFPAEQSARQPKTPAQTEPNEKLAAYSKQMASRQKANAKMPPMHQIIFPDLSTPNQDQSTMNSQQLGSDGTSNYQSLMRPQTSKLKNFKASLKQMRPESEIPKLQTGNYLLKNDDYFASAQQTTESNRELSQNQQVFKTLQNDLLNQADSYND